jgi:hypothetical protein
MNQPTPMYRFVDGKMQVGVLVDGMVQRTLEDGTQVREPLAPICGNWASIDVAAAESYMICQSFHPYPHIKGFESIAYYFQEKGRILGVKQVGEQLEVLEEQIEHLKTELMFAEQRNYELWEQTQEQPPKGD